MQKKQKSCSVSVKLRTTPSPRVGVLYYTVPEPEAMHTKALIGMCWYYWTRIA